jgi:hypothetical protein
MTDTRIVTATDTAFEVYLDIDALRRAVRLYRRTLKEAGRSPVMLDLQAVAHQGGLYFSEPDREEPAAATVVNVVEEGTVRVRLDFVRSFLVMASDTTLHLKLEEDSFGELRLVMRCGYELASSPVFA